MNPSPAPATPIESPLIADAATLVRVHTMVKTVNDEIEDLELDDPAVERLSTLQAGARDLLVDALGDELREELTRLVPVGERPASPVEAAVVQAQLAGWLDGLAGSMPVAVMERRRRAALTAGSSEKTAPGPQPVDQGHPERTLGPLAMADEDRRTLRAYL